MPVADKNGTAMIIKIKLMRPSPDSAWHTPPAQYARVQAYSMLPLKMLSSVARGAQGSTAHLRLRTPSTCSDRALGAGRILQAHFSFPWWPQTMTTKSLRQIMGLSGDG